MAPLSSLLGPEYEDPWSRDCPVLMNVGALELFARRGSDGWPIIVGASESTELRRGGGVSNAAGPFKASSPRAGVLPIS